ncbi:Serine hydrolase FSH [Parasponia andersonii]|uniref:Serine hydrolase FSH n=1 Tax=Parasponia andersonii TaxID=3476 RepID=A0A2P5ADG7_PARAD|nr:Serine hydrolase FSH [Parasponia andersonii]
MENQTQLEKPRILCLHGSRSSGLILKSEIQNRWPETMLEKLDLVFLNGAYLVQGKSGVEELYDPPYYEWFQANVDFSEFTNFEECVAYIEDYMANNGPFDGFLGFSQGAVLTAALPGMQNEN